MKIKLPVIGLILLLFCINAFAQKIQIIDTKDLYDKYNAGGCITIFDVKNAIYYKYNPEDCATGYLPASTFKIPNSLIYLETGTISPNDTIKWDGVVRGRKTLNRDHTLETALQYSVVWVYERLTKQIGLDETKKWLTKFDYGNKKVSGNYPFWLFGDIRISADQQVEFLKKFYNDELPIKKEHIDLIKKYLILENEANYVLRGKTGWAQPNDSLNIGWLVGYLTVNDNIYMYATNVRAENPDNRFNSRFEITKEVFKRLGIISEM